MCLTTITAGDMLLNYRMAEVDQQIGAPGENPDTMLRMLGEHRAGLIHRFRHQYIELRENHGLILFSK